MGISSLEQIADAYIAHGGTAGTPAALVENGTRPEQRVFTGTIGTLPATAAGANIRSPALIIIGGVVGLRDGLNWYTGAKSGDAVGANWLKLSSEAL